MSVVDIVDRYSSTLSAPYVSGAASLVVTSGAGLPAGACNFYMLVRAEGANTEEVFHVTNVAGTTLTVAGAQAGTAASNHASGAAVVGSIWTKAAFQSLMPVEAATPHEFLTSIAADGTVGQAQPADADLAFTDVTTGNVTSAAHGFAPKSPADAAKFLNGAATPAYAQVKDADLATTDVTTNNVSTAKHGFAPKAPNDATKFLDGTGAYSTPAGASINFSDNEIPSGTIDGSNPTFTLAHAPIALHLYLNGRRQAPLSGSPATGDYALVGSTITMSNIPALGDTLLADYRY